MTKTTLALILAVCSSTSFAAVTIDPNCSDPCECLTPAEFAQIEKYVAMERAVRVAEDQNDNRDDRLACLDAGTNNHVSKPTDQQNMFENLARLRNRGN